MAISLIVMLLWLVLADIAHHSDHHPYLVFGLGWGLYVSANYLGLVLVRLVAGGTTMTAELGVALLWATGVVNVLKLLAKGRSKIYIAETLYISENTVRGHSRRLYTKLGVHTRDELQAMLGI